MSATPPQVDLSQAGAVAVTVVAPGGVALAIPKPPELIWPAEKVLGVSVQSVFGVAVKVTCGVAPVVVVQESAVLITQEFPLQYCALTGMASGETEPYAFERRRRPLRIFRTPSAKPLEEISSLSVARMAIFSGSVRMSLKEKAGLATVATPALNKFALMVSFVMLPVVLGIVVEVTDDMPVSGSTVTADNVTGLV